MKLTMAASGPNDGNQDTNHDADEAEIITVGRLVEVASRTWPGINKPGGVARVVEVHFDDDECDDNKDSSQQQQRKAPTHVNVRYMVGSSREKRVPVEYVQLAPQYETTSRAPVPSSDSASNNNDNDNNSNYVASSLRDRSMLLGRCRRCGSLRTDCGSCDWAVEEEAVIAATTTSGTMGPNPIKSSSRRKNDKNQSKHGILSDDDGDDDDDSSINSDDDNSNMKRLRTLIRRTQRQRRQRHRKPSDANGNSLLAVTDNSNSSANPEKRTSRLDLRENRLKLMRSKWRRRYPALLDDSSSSSSESDLDDLNNVKLGRKKHQSIRGRSRIKHTGKSILESMPATTTSNPTKRKEVTSSLAIASRSVSSSQSSNPRQKQKLNQATPSLPIQLSDSDSDETAEIPRRNTKEDKRIASGAASSSISYDQQLLELEARARFQMKQQKDEAPSGDMDAEFIQPEGEEAVENLPDDMVDMSRSVPYKDLGGFFDSMANKVEDEILPDFKLKLAGLHRKLRGIQSATRINDSPSTIALDSAKQLLEEYHMLWDGVRLTLIQNGTDQCRATLRRLMDDKLYRKHRKELTTKERKHCRGAGIMDARNLRMDAMDDSAEAFVRKLKDAVVQCETECAESSQNDAMDVGSADTDEDDGVSSAGHAYYDDTSSDSSEGDDNDLDLLPITAMANSDLLSQKHPMPFGPHQHATRKKGESGHKKEKSKKSCSSASKSSKSTRKRAKTLGGDAQHDKRRGKSSTIHIGEARQSSSNVENSTTGTARVPLERDRNRTSMHSEVDGDRRSGTKRKTRPRTGQQSSSSHEEASFAIPRAPKETISERMQSFLDANKANGTRVDSEDEEREEGTVTMEEGTYLEKRRDRQRGPKTVVDGTEASDRFDMNHQEDSEEEQRDSILPIARESHFILCDTPALFTQLSISTFLAEDSARVVVDGESSNLERDWEELLFEMEKVLAENPASVVSFLERAYNMLKRHGGRTIQEMIASNNHDLSLHLRTLSLCVRSLNFFVPNDETPVIFTKDCQDHFLHFLVLQMVDALYSLNLPSAWALEVEHKEAIVRKLTPLRNGLALQIPLVEAVSRCIIQSFGCQQWRRSQNQNNVFVSSVDPKCWSDFLESGKKVENPEVTRFQKLGRVWPRIEADALWRILAFSSSARSVSTDKSIFRLQIISKLFSTGVLATSHSKDEGKLPPSEEQLLACQREAGYFSALVRKGVMDHLPKTDSMLVKLVQRALQLQSDSYKEDDSARACCFPVSSDDAIAKKTSPMFWRITHPLSFDLDSLDSRHVSICDFPFDIFNDTSDASYKKILYPASNLLSGCLSLVANWSEHVPQKKIRQNRLTNSLKALRNDLLKEANEPPEPKRTGNSFEDAFAMRPPVEIGVGSERVSIFQQEAASYIQLFGFLSAKNEVNPDLAQSIWQNMSDDVMKKRQVDIIELRESSERYKGDAYRLFAALKIMVTLLFIQMNLSPWHLSLGKRITRLFLHNAKPEIGKVSFVMSCIIVCMDCFCDLDVGPHVFSRVYEILIFAFRNLTTTIGKGESSLDGENLDVSFFDPVLVKCMKMHLTSSKGTHESFHLRLCLSLVRAIETFKSVKQHSLEPSPANSRESIDNQGGTTSNNDESDDMWGDLDDSDLAALDLGDGVPESQKVAPNRGLFWELLSGTLDQSKPSKRYAILGNSSTIASVPIIQMTSMGKFLVAESLHDICDCFSAAIASAEEDSETSSQRARIVSTWIKPNYEDDEDSQFCSRIARKLTSELCLLAEKFPMCKRFVSDHADDMLFNFLKELVDSSRLEKFPSCNLERIGENSGKIGTKQALMMLDIFNDDSFQEVGEGFDGIALRRLQNKRRKRATETWSFCSKLGIAFSRNSSTGCINGSVTEIGDVLLNLDDDLGPEFKFSDDMISLENEIFKTFRLLRNIVSHTARHDVTFVTFEKISSCSIMMLANHILRIVQSLKYNDQTSSDRDYKKARLSELLSSFVELFVSFGAWILREGAKNQSKTWSFFQTYLRDRLFTPILRNQPLDTTIALQEVIASAQFVLNAWHSSVGVPSLPTINCVGLLGCSKYLSGYFHTSILRRSRQLFIATALNQQNLGLSNALLEAMIESSDDLEEATACVLGTAFPERKGSQNRTSNIRFVWPYSSPMQKHIDEYLQFVEENLGRSTPTINDDWWDSMATMKKSFLKNNLIPRLNSNSLGIPKKRRLLLLLKYLLECDCPKTLNTTIPDGFVDARRTMDVNFVCDIIKAVRSNLHRCLMQSSVHNDMASVVFACSIHLAGSTLVLDGQEENLVAWSHFKMLGTKGKTMLDLSSHAEIIGSYVWIFFQWLQGLGRMVVDNDRTNAMELEAFTSLRQHWQSTQCHPHGGIDEESLDLEDSKSLEAWDRLLIEFEDLAFPSKTKRHPNSVVNIYAKPQDESFSSNGKTTSEASYEQWVPSVAVKRSLKEMMAAILSNS